jgi:ATP-dependent helicase/nuclease subunit B
MLSEKIEQCTIFDNSEIWVDGFSLLTPQQCNVIGKLLQKAERVNFTLCTDSLGNGMPCESTDVFWPIKKMEEKLLKIALDRGIPVEKPAALTGGICPKFKDSRELSSGEKPVRIPI